MILAGPAGQGALLLTRIVSHHMLAGVIAGMFCGIPAHGQSAVSQGVEDKTPVVTINLLQFESAVGDIDARVTLQLPPAAKGRKHSSPDDYVLIDETTVDNSVLEVKGNKPFATLNTMLKTRYEVDNAGDEFLYPFDRHHAEIRIFVEKAPAGASIMDQGIEVPVHADTNLCRFAGYNVKVTPGPLNSDTFIDLIVDVDRTGPIKVFSIFIVIVMWMVAIGVLLMALQIALSGHMPEVGNLGFAGALLFALPAIRATQPRVPPMGVLSDYLGFFWGELIVAVSLLILVICWIRRKNLQ